MIHSALQVFGGNLPARIVVHSIGFLYALQKVTNLLSAQAIQVHGKGTTKWRPQIQRGHVWIGEAHFFKMPIVFVAFKRSIFLIFFCAHSNIIYKDKASRRSQIFFNFFKNMSTVFVTFKRFVFDPEGPLGVPADDSPSVILPLNITREQLAQFMSQFDNSVAADPLGIRFYANDKKYPILGTLEEALLKQHDCINIEDSVIILWDREVPTPEISELTLPSPIKCISQGYLGLYDGSLWRSTFQSPQPSLLAKISKAAISCILLIDDSLFIGSMDGKIYYKKGDAEPARVVYSSEQSVQCLARSSDRLFAGLWNGDVVSFDLVDAQIRPMFSKHIHDSAIVSLTCVDSFYLISSSWDRSVKTFIWTLDSLASQSAITFSSQSVTSACFLVKPPMLVCGHPDGKVSLVGFSDGTLSVRARSRPSEMASRITSLCSTDRNRFACAAVSPQNLGEVFVCRVSPTDLSGKSEEAQCLDVMQSVSIPGSGPVQCLDWHQGILYASRGCSLYCISLSPRPFQ